MFGVKFSGSFSARHTKERKYVSAGNKQNVTDSKKNMMYYLYATARQFKLTSNKITFDLPVK